MKITKFLPYVLSVIIPIALHILNRSEPFISYPFDIILYLLIFLGVIAVSNLIYLISLERNTNFSLKLFKAVVDSWMLMRVKLLELPKKKRITTQDLVETLVEPGKAMNGVLVDVCFKMLEGSPASYHRIRELMAKARKNDITPEEAEELRKLLEEEKKQKEKGGDIIGAILLGLLIIFVLGVIAGLLGED